MLNKYIGEGNATKEHQKNKGITGRVDFLYDGMGNGLALCFETAGAIGIMAYTVEVLIRKTGEVIERSKPLDELRANLVASSLAHNLAKDGDKYEVRVSEDIHCENGN